MDSNRREGERRSEERRLAELSIPINWDVVDRRVSMDRREDERRTVAAGSAQSSEQIRA